MSPEVEAQLLQDVGAIKANVTTLLEHAKTHEKRIVAVERKMWWGSGVVGAVVALIVPKARTILGI